MRRVTSMGVVELASHVRARTLSPVEIVEAFIAQAERTGPLINALVTPCFDDARREAEKAERNLSMGQAPRPLEGIPFTIKDCLDVAGLRTTSGLVSRSGHVPAEDAHVVAELRRAGGVLLGKTNLPDACWSAETENRLFGRTNNPWDPARSAGGSSGGSAALVAAEGTALDIGSDIAGSIRIPAAWNGVVGLRVTSGTLSERGMWPPTRGRMVDIESLGPLVRRVEDAALVLSVLRGEPRCVMDHAILRGQAVAAWTSDGLVEADSETCAAVETAARALERAGMRRVQGAPAARRAAVLGWCAYFDDEARLGLCDAFGNGERWSVQSELLRALLRASRVSDSAIFSWLGSDLGSRVARSLVDADAWRVRIRKQLTALIGEAGISVSPVQPTAARSHGWYLRDLAPITSLSFTTWVNLAGLPVLTVPVSIGRDGMPIGVQLVGAPGSEAALLAAGLVVERACSPEWRAPPVAAAPDAIAYARSRASHGRPRDSSSGARTREGSFREAERAKRVGELEGGDSSSRLRTREASEPSALPGSAS